MIEKWLISGWQQTPMVLLTTVFVYLAILIYTRLAGLRSFSKMSAADFAMTVAVGSLFASTIASPQPSAFVGMIAIASLFAGQCLTAVGRQKWTNVSHAVDNKPLLLMARGNFLEKNLTRSNVTRNDIYGKLREANALHYENVVAVVFETTGDISVLHSSDVSETVEPDFLQNVLGKEILISNAADDSGPEPKN